MAAAGGGEMTEEETNNQVVERFCRFLLDFSPAARNGMEDEEEGVATTGERPYDAQLVLWRRLHRACLVPGGRCVWEPGDVVASGAPRKRVDVSSRARPRRSRW